MLDREETPRERARRLGEPTYIGRPCLHCGGTVRLTKTGECPCYRSVYHRDRYARKSPRKRAQRRGDLTYTSPSPCKECGEHVRWTSTKRCAFCHPEDQTK